MTRFRSNGAYPPTCEHCLRPKESHGGLYGMGACPPIPASVKKDGGL